MKKRSQIGFHRKHETKSKKNKEKKDDPWGMNFSEDNWNFGKKSIPDFGKVVPNFNKTKSGKF